MDGFLNAMRTFVSSMTKSYDITQMCYELSETVTSVLAAAGAGVTVGDTDGKLRYVSATDERASDLERVQEEVQVGPCMTAFTQKKVVAVTDVRLESAWPEYLETAVQHGFHAVLGLPLLNNGTTFGAIDVYNDEPRLWSKGDVEIATTFADMATAYLLRTSELVEAGRLTEQLEGALDSRVLIEQAKGVVATSHGISMDDAFAALRGHARKSSKRLAEVAQGVVDGSISIQR